VVVEEEVLAVLELTEVPVMVVMVVMGISLQSLVPQQNMDMAAAAAVRPLLVTQNLMFLVTVETVVNTIMVLLGVLVLLLLDFKRVH